MRSRRLTGEAWVDVYREGVFGGRGKRLGPGERAPIDQIGSIIVGPRATGILTNRKGQEILKLPPSKLVADLSKLRLAQSASYLHVSPEAG